MRRAAVLAVLVWALTCAAGAPAYYGNGAKIVSASLERQEQADDGSQAADIASEGRYVTFQTRARNFFADDDPDPPGQFRVGGIFRRDLDAGALVLVADGDVRDEDDNSLQVRGAANPSVSANGRYVAFSTGEALVAGDSNDHTDVYVRDMSLPRSDPAAYDLVSARDTSAGGAPASYAQPAQPRPKLDPGSEISSNTSISDDGRYVVFRTAAVSNLPDRAALDTAAGQLFVRDRTAGTTTLVTHTSGSAAPAGGAGPAAAISADGTTVAWAGQNAPAQTRFLNGENTDPTVFYYLWQRIADAATRRITGIADLDDPACPPNSTISLSSTATGPCYGPLTEPEAQVAADISGVTPGLSADGRRVAFLTGAGPRPNNQTPGGPDLWITDMTPGVSRKAGSAELTREGAPSDTAASSAIERVAMSPDGRYLGLTTFRTTFVLRALTFIGPRRTFPDQRELYVVDLSAHTIERALRAADGGEANGSSDPIASLSNQAARLAFISSATNLFFGDANDRSDAFGATRTAEPPPEAPPPPPPADSSRDVEENLGANDSDGPELAVSARAPARATVELTIRVPGAGRLAADARARIGRRTRKVAAGRSRSRRAGRVRIVLRLSRRYRRELRRKRRIVARVTIAFRPSGRGARLRDSARVTFRQNVPRPKRKR